MQACGRRITPHFVYTLHDKGNTQPIHTHICKQNDVTHQTHNTNHQAYYKLSSPVQKLYLCYLVLVIIIIIIIIHFLLSLILPYAISFPYYGSFLPSFFFLISLPS